MHRPIRRSRFALALLGLFSGVSQAALDLPVAMQGLETATVATVVLVPPMAIYRVPLDALALQEQGCHYTTDDPAAIRRLAAVLRSADVTANPVYQRPDIREGAYFTLGDGSKFSMLVGDHAGGRLPVLGVAETSSGGSIQSASVSANATLSDALRDWARTRDGTSRGLACNLQSPVAQDPTPPPPVPQ